MKKTFLLCILDGCGIGEHYNTVKDCLDDQYSKDITDEFIKPSIINDGKL